MKLILCSKCQDIVRLQNYRRYCSCGQSSGFYKDDLRAVYSGDAIPLGIDNHDLTRAVLNQPVSGQWEAFKAGVMPVKCSTFKKDK